MVKGSWAGWVQSMRRHGAGRGAIARDLAERRAASAVQSANAAQPGPDWTTPLGTGGGRTVEGTPRDGQSTLVVPQGALVTTWALGVDKPIAERRGAVTYGPVAESPDGALARFDGSRLEVWPTGHGVPQLSDAPPSPLRAAWEPEAAQGYFHLDVRPQVLGFDGEEALVTVAALQHGPDGGPGPSWGGGAHHILWWRCTDSGVWQVTDERLHRVGHISVPPVLRLDGVGRALLGSAWMELRTGAHTPLPGPMRWSVGRSVAPDRSHVLAAAVVALRDPDGGGLDRAWRLGQDGILEQLPAIPEPPDRRRPHDHLDPGGPLWIMEDMASPDGRHLVLATTEEVLTKTLGDPVLRVARHAEHVIAISQAGLTWWDLSEELPRLRFHLIDSRCEPLLFTADSEWLVIEHPDRLAAYRTEP